jgi:hypothetical protein
MNLRIAGYIIAALCLLLLGFYLSYQAKQRRPTPAPLAGNHSEPVAPPDAAPTTPPATSSGESPPAWPASGELLTEDDIPALPAEIQDLLADPGWNQPYITPSFAPAEAANAGQAAGQAAGPYRVNLLVDAPLAADKTSYNLDLQQDESGSYADVSLHAQLTANSAGRYPEVQTCIWAFRDGTIQYFAAGAEAEMLNTTHRYDLTNTQVRVYIVRLLAVDSDGGLSYTDSLPIRIGAQ